MHLIHKWGSWQKGTAFRTLNGVRTGQQFPCRARECEICLVTKIKELYK